MAPQTTSSSATATGFISKTQHYLKVKKPQLERERRARMNKCLDQLKTLVAEFQSDDAILRMDKAEMLEAALVFMRKEVTRKQIKPIPTPVPMDSFRNGYMNAVNEVSRVMACTPAMSVEVGKAVMTNLGHEFQKLIRADINTTQIVAAQAAQLESSKQRPISPASSGYHSDDCEELPSPPATTSAVWRPW